MTASSAAAPGCQGPVISVVMPTYRRAHQVALSIESLLQGDWQDFELLIRDDGNGQDGTREAVDGVAMGDSRVKYTRNSRSLRMPENLNSGLREARGEFIAVCHDHDIYRADYLSALLESLRRHPSAGFAHCAIEMLTQDGNVTTAFIGPWPELTPGREWLKLMLRQFSCPVCALTMVPRRVYQQHGLYDPAYGFVSDVEMWMRLAATSDVSYVSKPLIKVREREPDHAATATGLAITRIIARIHRKFIPIAYSGITSTYMLARVHAKYAILVARTAGTNVARRAFRGKKRQ